MDVPAKKTKSSSKQKKSAADMVSTKTTSVDLIRKGLIEREIVAMSMAEFDKHEAEISEAYNKAESLNKL